jgi:hypothetical protein
MRIRNRMSTNPKKYPRWISNYVFVINGRIGISYVYECTLEIVIRSDRRYRVEFVSGFFIFFIISIHWFFKIFIIIGLENII